MYRRIATRGLSCNDTHRALTLAPHSHTLSHSHAPSRTLQQSLALSLALSRIILSRSDIPTCEMWRATREQRASGGSAMVVAKVAGKVAAVTVAAAMAPSARAAAARRLSQEAAHCYSCKESERLKRFERFERFERFLGAIAMTGGRSFAFFFVAT